MAYATNKGKTEQRFFVSGVNCDPTTARDEMMIAKAQWNDTSEIVCYHGFQSFKAGEVTPEVAHEVGVKLAEKMWGGRFQVIVATHLNTECLHNHFVVNSVSFTDGKHYHDNKKNLRLLRRRSDELCREYAAVHFFRPCLRRSGGLVFPAPPAVRHGNFKLDVYSGGFPFCHDGLYQVQRHDGGAVCLDMDKIRVLNAKEDFIFPRQSLLRSVETQH